MLKADTSFFGGVELQQIRKGGMFESSESCGDGAVPLLASRKQSKSQPWKKQTTLKANPNAPLESYNYEPPDSAVSWLRPGELWAQFGGWDGRWRFAGEV